jgi:hypothetical protein
MYNSWCFTSAFYGRRSGGMVRVQVLVLGKRSGDLPVEITDNMRPGLTASFIMGTTESVMKYDATTQIYMA